MNNAAMTTAAPKLSAAQFDQLCSEVGYARSSVAGCASESERAKEIARLQQSVAELAGAVLGRKNDRLEERRVLMIRSATAQIVTSTTHPTNDTIGEGTIIEFKGNFGLRGFQACITQVIGTSHFHCRLDNGELTKAPLPLALLATSQWRIVRK